MVILASSLGGMGTNYFPAADISELKREQQIMLVLAWYPAVFATEKNLLW
jgi:hypothetical protein